MKEQTSTRTKGYNQQNPDLGKSLRQMAQFLQQRNYIENKEKDSRPHIDSET